MMLKFLSVKEFTGYHMLAVLVLFFGTIITVNLTLAYYASISWTGLVVKNSYVASQEFDARTAEREAQAKLGWQSSFVYEKDHLVLNLKDGDGNAPVLSRLQVKIGRPVEESDDQVLDLISNGEGSFTAAVHLSSGIWQVDIEALKDEKAIWNKSYRFVVGQ